MRADALHTIKLKSAGREPELSISGLDPVPLSKIGTCHERLLRHVYVAYCLHALLSRRLFARERVRRGCGGTRKRETTVRATGIMVIVVIVGRNAVLTSEAE